MQSNDTSGPRRRPASNADGPTFTFREAKRLLKKNASARPTDASRKRRTDVREVGKRWPDETKRLLARLGADDGECERFVSMCETCGVGRLGLNATSVRTLFGDDADGKTDDRRHQEDRSFYTTSDEEDVIGDKSRDGGCIRRARFLRSVMADGTTKHEPHNRDRKRQATTKSITKYVYFITIAVSTCKTGTNNYNARRPDTVLLCLPPAEHGGRHGTKAIDQDRLADLAVMLTYVVVRYIYNVLRTEIAAKTRESTSTGGMTDSRRPVIVIQHAAKPTANVGTPTQSEWYRRMREKILRGEDGYARCLSLLYCCNVL